MTQMPLDGLRILIVEDDYYLAADNTLTIESAGGTVVGPFATAEDALHALDSDCTHLAIIDINLGAGPSFAFARHLEQVGRPFLITTGYDDAVVPDDLKKIKRLEKPFRSDELIRATAKLYEATKPA